MIIGICGKSCSGKSTLTTYLKESKGNNVVCLSIDKVGHNVLEISEVQRELIKSFGNDIIKNSSVDRKRLGELVFNSRIEMSKLTDITWKYMQIEIDEFINQNQDKIIILDWLLLPITKYFDMCDIKILLDIPYEIRKKRARLRDNITEEEFALREKASIDFNKEDFDYCLNNNNEEEIKRMVKRI